MARWERTLCSVLTGLSLTISSSGLAYDKNDNQITEEIQKKLTLPVVRVRTGFSLPCNKIPFYELDEDECLRRNDSIPRGYQGDGIALKGKMGTLYILTNDHILPPDESRYHLFVNGISAYPLQRDHERDLALLMLSTTKADGFTPYDGCIGEGSSVGDFVVSAGYSGKEPSWIQGKIHSMKNVHPLWRERFYFIAALPVIPGNSGSPVYSFQNGESVLVGILTTGSEEGMVGGLGGVISSKAINEFLADVKTLSHYSCNGRNIQKTEKK